MLAVHILSFDWWLSISNNIFGGCQISPPEEFKFLWAYVCLNVLIFHWAMQYAIFIGFNDIFMEIWAYVVCLFVGKYLLLLHKCWWWASACWASILLLICYVLATIPTHISQCSVIMVWWKMVSMLENAESLSIPFCFASQFCI